MRRGQDAGARTAATLGAIDEPELLHRVAHRVVGVPPTPAEPARREPALVQPAGLVANPLRGVARAGPRMRGARPVRVQAEIPECARPLEPPLLVFSECGIGRADQRDDVEAARARAPERVEATPGSIVERPLEVTGDDSRARHTAAEST